MDTLRLIWFHVAVFASIVSLSNGWELMGVRMCQEQCQNRKGCVAVAFDAAHLKCTLVSKHTDFSADSMLHVLKVLETEAVLKDCNQSDRLVVNKRKKLICVPTTEPVTAIDLVFMVPRRSRMKSFFKFIVLNGEIAAVHLTFQDIRAVVYLKDRNRIVLAQRQRIISTSVTFRGEKHIRTIILSHLLTVFHSYTYNGVKAILKIPKAMMKHKVPAFYCGTSSLYYATGNTIMKTSKGKTTKVTRINYSSKHFLVSDMIIFRNHLYITAIRNGHVIMIRIDLSGQHKKTIILTQKQSHKTSFAVVGVVQY